MEWKVDLGRVSISNICLPTYHHEWFSNGLIVK